MHVRVKGRVFSGVGEGAYYVEKYRSVLEKHLGEAIYPGTLNLELDVCFYELANVYRPIVIEPPDSGLGYVYAYKGWVNGVRVLLLKPAITRHGCSVVELVSGKHLRSLLNLKDGDFVEVILEFNQAVKCEF